MRLDSNAHLTYCSNIHPGERWTEVATALATHVPQIREHLRHEGPFGLGLRLSADAARDLLQPDTRARFIAWMQAHDAYVFTLNGFPYGPFHGTPVKQAVYRPDWSTPERVAYTRDLITLLADLLPAGERGSISTVPGGFRYDPSAATPGRILDGLLDAAHACWEVAESRGLDLCVALEPEPMCMLETTDEAIAFFERFVFSRDAVASFARRTRLSHADATSALRTHLGVCLDTCHAAIEFEDPLEAPARLKDAGIRLGKVQVTAGLHVPSPNAATLERLEAFADDTYLHQVVVRAPSGLTRLLDLPEALDAARAGTLPAGDWRIHVHVPVFSELAPPMRATSDFIRAALPALQSQTDHFEVETYTWGVLPPDLASIPLADAIARELKWAQSNLDLS
ncbi:MAG: metabolite traffic protein EboE [Myxococcota bacterium]